MLDVRGHVWPHLSLGAVCFLVCVEHTRVQESWLLSIFTAQTSSPAAAGSDNPSGTYSNIASIEQWYLESMFLYLQLPLIWCSSQNPKRTAAPPATEKSVPDCSLSSAGSNQCIYRVCSAMMDLTPSIPSSMCLRNSEHPPLCTSSVETDGQGWEHLLPRTKRSEVPPSGLVSVCRTLSVTTHRFCQPSSVASGGSRAVCT